MVSRSIGGGKREGARKRKSYNGEGGIRARFVGRNALSISYAYNSYNERETANARLRG